MKHYTKRKRPDTITVSMDARQVDRLDKCAHAEGRSRSNLIQKIVSLYLESPQREG